MAGPAVSGGVIASSVRDLVGGGEAWRTCYGHGSTEAWYGFFRSLCWVSYAVRSRFL